MTGNNMARAFINQLRVSMWKIKNKDKTIGILDILRHPNGEIFYKIHKSEPETDLDIENISNIALENLDKDSFEIGNLTLIRCS